VTGHAVKVYIYIDTEDNSFIKLDTVVDCRKQATQQILNGGEE